MNPTYRFNADYEYWATRQKRQRRQRPFVLRPVGLLVPFATLFLTWLWLRATDPLTAAELGQPMFGYPLFFVSLLLTGRALIHWRARNAFAKGATETTCILSIDGISVEAQLAQSEEDWSLYPNAVRFPDGILLMRNRAIGLWLPDSAMSGATPSEVIELVRSRSKLRHVA